VSAAAAVVVRPLSGGRLAARRALFFADAPPDERISVPVACWLVERPRGRLVFVTGLHPDTAADPVGRLGAARAGRFAVGSPPGDDAIASLARLGIAPDDSDDPARPPATIDGEHDAIGDGTAVAIPTPGHTPGHHSLRVTLGSGRVVVLVGDAAYTERHLEDDTLPPRAAVWHAPTMADSMARLRAMRDRGRALLLYSHDDARWRALAAAGGRLD
jgi:glyoxylase-like metal-dependent hydrolase (beta-lactamase superfamily II)